MSNYNLVPYNYLHLVDSWTVENLMFKFTEDQVGTPLKNLVTFNKERVSSENINPDQDYPYIEIKSIILETGEIEPTYLKGSNLPTRAKLLGRKGDILVSIVRPERGIIAIIPPELDGCIVSNTFVVLTPKQISPEYLFLLLKDDDVRRDFSMLARGTTTPTLGIKEFKNYSLPLSKVPTDMDQSAKDLVSDWRKEGKGSRPLKDIVEDIFVKELLNIEVIEEEGEKETFIILPYDELANRWDVKYHVDQNERQVLWSVQSKKLGELGDLKVGAPLPNKSDVQGDIPYIRVQDLDDDSLYIVNGDVVNVGEGIEDKTSRGILRKDDILISRVGNFGRSALVQPELEGALANHNLLIFSSNNQVILPKFLTCFLKTRWAKQQFNMYATGLFLQSNFLKEVQIPVPSLSQQLLIINAIEQEFTTNKIEEIERETLRFTHQVECVDKVYETLLSENRKALVNIPVGTGKSSILIAILRRLFNSGKVNKVLYLTERRVIAEQFRQICREKLAELPCDVIDLLNESDKRGIFTGLINKVDQDMVSLFDLIIFDGYNPTWTHFLSGEFINGFVLGITSSSLQSYSDYQEVLKLFELDELTFSYGIEQAISNNQVIDLNDRYK